MSKAQPARIGTIEVTVRLYLDCDVEEDEARNIVENMDYDFDHLLIQDTEIIHDDITERFDGYDYGN